jgi:MFS family permease
MSTPEAQSLQHGDGTENSTQKGCTSSLLLSCIVLTLTTAFVFGWGIAAPNMYNHYTEPFLKGNDPCKVQAASQANQNQTTATTTVAAAAVAPIIVNNENVAEEANGDVVEAQLDDEGNEIDEVEPTESTPPKESFQFGPELIKGIPQTIFLIGAFIGAITGPFWSNLFDRKRTVFANYIFCFGSSLCVLLAYYFTQPWLFYLSRLLLGYQGGMACVVVPPFIGEISSQKVRGAAGAAFQLSLTLVILFAQIIGLPFIAGTCYGWGWGLGIVFLLPFLGIFLLLLLPNSPTQMLLTYGNEEQAITDLKKLRGTPNVQADIALIREQTSGNKTESLSIPQVRKTN